MSTWSQGTYIVINRDKYVGNGLPRFRSSWEHRFMTFLDTNENILQWVSESIRIPYRHPLTGKMANYVPDFLITYRTKNNTMRAELIEIKPKGQSVLKEGMKPKERAVVAINYAKWAAAQVFCKNQGIAFRILTEDDLWHQGGTKR